ncbi:dynein light chain roadblock-type 2-like isoform X1 [Centruroides vittatus]|uniref:dynein light chain roadblock-type 2-like isoform X1 n=1 Tax=Centruroides vittatus TaxID=120091 RepID=UPI003510C749
MAHNKIEEALRRIQSQKGGVGLIVTNSDGVTIKTNMDNETAIRYAGLTTQMIEKSRNAIRQIDISNDLTFIRIHSKRDEIMIASDKNYVITAIQKVDA